MLQVGRFHSNGQQYSLMTMEAMKASQDQGSRDKPDLPFPIMSNSSMVYIGNSMHVIEPVTQEDAGIMDDARKTFDIGYSLYTQRVIKTATHLL